jgi:uncharacterized protein YceH (UPF0502 family)
MTTTPHSANTDPWPVLAMMERRILGVIVEKAKTTPEAYPLTLNATVTGCNQKSNRDPIMNLDDEDVEECLIELQKKGLSIRVSGGRVDRWKHNLYEAWGVGKVDLAILAELLLRGPQTEGELRSRVNRMEPIEDLDKLKSLLKPLVDRRLVLFLGPEGRRGTLITHGFHAPQELEALRQRSSVEEPAAHVAASPSRAASSEQLASLEAGLRQAQDEIGALRSQVQQMYEALQTVSQQLKALKDSLGA